MAAAAPDDGAIVVARYDYKATDESELTIRKSERLLLLDDSQHWWKVQNSNGQEGYVPSNYMKKVRQGLFSSLKNTLTKKKSKKEPQQPTRQSAVGSPPGAAGGSGAALPKSGSSSGAGGDRHLGLLGAASPLEPAATTISPFAFHSNGSGGGHVGEFLPSPTSPALNGASDTSRMAIARYAYQAAQDDELSMTKGDRIAVYEESTDGWWRGRELRSGRVGWFPSNYVSQETQDTPTLASAAAGPAAAVASPSLPAAAPPTLKVLTATAEPSVPVASPALAPSPSMAAPTAAAPAPAAADALFLVETLYRFTATHSEEMGFRENETLYVLATPPNDPEWWLARNCTGQSGLIPKNYVRVLPPAAGDSSSPQPPAAPAPAAAAPVSDPRLQFVAADEQRSLAIQPYYWGRISRGEADRMMMHMARPGEFIIRTGESNPNDLTLTMRARDKNRNFKIRQVNEASGPRYNIGQKYFNSLEELVLHYREHPIFRSADERCHLVGPFQHPSLAGTQL